MDEKEESSPNGSDSEASSSSQSTSAVDAEDVESDIEDLEELLIPTCWAFGRVCEDLLQESGNSLSKKDGQVLPEM